MRKILICFSLLSCTSKNYDVVWYTGNIKKCIQNLEVMENWVRDDYNNGDIKKYCANNYLLVIENTKLSLELLEIKKDGTKVEK